VSLGAELDVRRARRRRDDHRAGRGTVTTVYADSFQHRQISRERHLRGGQTIPFARIADIEVTRTLSDEAVIRITLTDDRIVEGRIDAGLYPFGFMETTLASSASR